MPGNAHPSLPPGTGFNSCAEERLGEAQRPISDGANQCYASWPRVGLFAFAS
jgi:hypothetical protein